MCFIEVCSILITIICGILNLIEYYKSTLERDEKKRIEKEKRKQEIKEKQWKNQLNNMIKQIIKKFSMKIEIIRQKQLSILIEKRHEREKERERKRREKEREEKKRKEREEKKRKERKIRERIKYKKLKREIIKKYNEIKDGLPEPFYLDEFKLTKLKESNNDKCSICLETLKNKSQCLYLPCIHLFHSFCIMHWLLKHERCPECNINYKNESG